MRMGDVWLGADGIVRAKVLLPGAIQELPDSIECVAAVTQVAGGVPRPLLTDITRIHFVSHDARKYSARPENTKAASAHGMFVGSAVSKLVGNLYLKLNKPKVPSRVFTSEDEAIQWLKGFLPPG